MVKYFWFGLLLFTGISCLEEPDCIERRNDIVGITFKNYSDNSVLRLNIDSVATPDLNFSLVGDTTSSKILLPVNFFNDTTSYTIYAVEPADTFTLVLSYSSKLEFIDRDCGERFLLRNLQVVEHSFDSVKVVSTTPGIGSNANNIEIFN